MFRLRWPTPEATDEELTGKLGVVADAAIVSGDPEVDLLGERREEQ